MSDEVQESTVSGSGVHHLPGQQRYVYMVGGEQVGLADYRVSGDNLHLFHTEIDPVLRGSGLGYRMVQAVLDEIRTETDYRIIADCPFVAEFIERNPAYRELTVTGV